MSDASSFAISTVIANFTGEILTSLVPYLSENNFVGMLSYPLLTGIIYSYIYDMNTSSKYPGVRDGTNTLLMGSIGCLLISYIQSPIMSLLGLVNY